MTEPAELPWHVIHGGTLMALLRRFRAGEDPELVYAEEYANADDHQQVETCGDVPYECDLPAGHLDEPHNDDRHQQCGGPIWRYVGKRPVFD